MLVNTKFKIVGLKVISKFSLQTHIFPIYEIQINYYLLFIYLNTKANIRRIYINRLKSDLVVGPLSLKRNDNLKQQSLVNRSFITRDYRGFSNFFFFGRYLEFYFFLTLTNKTFPFLALMVQITCLSSVRDQYE